MPGSASVTPGLSTSDRSRTARRQLTLADSDSDSDVEEVQQYRADAATHSLPHNASLASPMSALSAVDLPRTRGRTHTHDGSELMLTSSSLRTLDHALSELRKEDQQLDRQRRLAARREAAQRRRDLFCSFVSRWWPSVRLILVGVVLATLYTERLAVTAAVVQAQESVQHFAQQLTSQASVLVHSINSRAGGWLPIESSVSTAIANDSAPLLPAPIAVPPTTALDTAGLTSRVWWPAALDWTSEQSLGSILARVVNWKEEPAAVVQ